MGKAIEKCIYPEPASKTLPAGFRVRKQVRDQWNEQRQITEIFRPATSSAAARERALQEARDFVTRLDREKRTGEIYRRFPERLNPPPKIVWRTTLPWDEWTPEQQRVVNEELQEEYEEWRAQQPGRKMRHYVEKRFLPWLEDNNSQGDSGKYSSAWKAFVEYSDAEDRGLPTKPISKIRPVDIDDYVDWMEAQRKPNGKPRFAEVTIKGYYANMRSIFRHWAAHEKTANPADSIKLRTKTERIRGRKKKNRVPTEDQLVALDKAIEADIEEHRTKHGGRYLYTRIILRYLNVVLLHTGMRIGEALALSIDDVDFEKMTITIQHALDGRELGWTKRGKKLGDKEKGTRAIPMIPAVAAAIRDWTELRTEYGYPEISACHAIFCHQAGDYLTADSARSYYENACSTSEAPLHITPHMLRHACNDRLRRAGVPPEVRRVLLGHADDDTNRNYTDPKALEARAALSALTLNRQSAQSAHNQA